MGKKKNPITILGETGVTVMTESFLPESAGEDKAELFKQRPLEEEAGGGLGDLFAEIDPKEIPPAVLNNPYGPMGEFFDTQPREGGPEPAEIIDTGADPATALANAILRGEDADPFTTPEGETVEEKPEPELSETFVVQFHEVKTIPEPEGPEPETKPAQGETIEGPLPMVERFTEMSVLKCILTDAEMKHCAEQMARLYGESAEAEAELKSVSSQYKATIAKLEQHISEEAAKYRAGHEFRKIQVVVLFDYETGRVWREREDTGEVIEDRVMTSKEAQRKLWPEK
jgi:hypothetical protein